MSHRDLDDIIGDGDVTVGGESFTLGSVDYLKNFALKSAFDMPTDFFGSSFFSGSGTFSFTIGFFATGDFTLDGIILGTFFHVRNLLINASLLTLIWVFHFKTREAIKSSRKSLLRFRKRDTNLKSPEHYSEEDLLHTPTGTYRDPYTGGQTLD